MDFFDYCSLFENYGKLEHNQCSGVVSQPLKTNDVITSKQCKSYFTREEDLRLTELVRIYGPHKKSWVEIAERMKNRSRKQCRDRYLNYLDPTICKNPFTPEEDSRLLELVAENGKKWIYLKKFFFGRTDMALKNRYILLERNDSKNFGKK